MSFLEHLDELRKRIVNACLAVAVGIAVTFWWIDPIFNFILAPTRRALPPGVNYLVYTQPGGVLALHHRRADRRPRRRGAVHHVPGVDVHRAGAVPTRSAWRSRSSALTTIGFLAGAGFNHYIAFPYLMKFFGTFNSPDLAFMPKLEDTFGLYTKMLIGMGVVFQMPTVVFFLAKMKLITAGSL